MTDPIKEPADLGEHLPDAKGQRLAKVIARSGLCSRREAERYIEQKRVQVDGKVIISPALNVTLDQIIVVDGQVIPDIEPTKLWRYYKPRGCLTTRHDPEGRATIYEYLPRQLQRLNAVGRLDFNSEGLLLLTNDGELVRQLTLPANHWLRRYRVAFTDRLTKGRCNVCKRD
ncbi:MAG: rRNA pseudouridine synthase [Rhodospirillaceae bacterium]|nr:rRNA pseudouridine synthase [Rhodospirillaceae bacterium]